MTRAGDAGPPRRENFCRIHKTLRMSPSMAAGVTGERRDVRRIVSLVGGAGRCGPVRAGRIGSG